MSVIDPTNYRVGRVFLLSDFMGCDSVYRHGYANPILHTDQEKLIEGVTLAEELEDIAWEHGPVSISYGYISPQLSRNIIKYQDPDKPSYHKWDAGAAADMVFHNMKGSPIEMARVIDEATYYSRMITYSESPYICIATRKQEDGSNLHYRCALYENRYMGPGHKPKHIKYPMGQNAEDSRLGKLYAVELEHDWVGAGYPTYHGGGRKQYQHMRVSQYTMVSDFLYYKTLVHNGQENRPPSTKSGMSLWMRRAKEAGEVYDHICNRLQDDERMSHVPITAAYNKHKDNMNWEKHFTLELGLTHSGDFIKECIYGHHLVKKAWIVEEEVLKLRIVGIDS